MLENYLYLIELYAKKKQRNTWETATQWMWFSNLSKLNNFRQVDMLLELINQPLYANIATIIG